jgi:myo-inositol-1-phosphate synthase
MSRIGAWFVGARGSVATTAQVGAAAMAAGLVPSTGMVTELPLLAEAPLPGVDEIVFGGHDVATVTLAKRAEQLAAEGVIPHGLPRILAAQLEAADGRILPGAEDGEPQAAAIGRLTRDLRRFRDEHGLDEVVVVNLASVEPVCEPQPAHASLDALRAALAVGEHVLPTSSLYAFAAVEAGCAYVNFTPSTGIQLPALLELAEERGTVWAGRDGKTGETLVKTVLAPMFAMRNLRVRSWAGTNLLGGGDGAALADPQRREAKLEAKDACLPSLLGYRPQMPLHIDHVEDMGEWKTAWDHVSFEGFLGVGMTMQFTWQGCDSALAAPLVLDLVRLAGAAQQSGQHGPLDALGFYFKEPAGSDEHQLDRQFVALLRWADTLDPR